MFEYDPREYEPEPWCHACAALIPSACRCPEYEVEGDELEPWAKPEEVCDVG
jgi:hypothetical protein